MVSRGCFAEPAPVCTSVRNVRGGAGIRGCSTFRVTPSSGAALFGGCLAFPLEVGLMNAASHAQRGHCSFGHGSVLRNGARSLCFGTQVAHRRAKLQHPTLVQVNWAAKRHGLPDTDEVATYGPLIGPVVGGSGYSAVLGVLAANPEDVPLESGQGYVWSAGRAR